jgi:hypothetical protein
MDVRRTIRPKNIVMIALMVNAVTTPLGGIFGNAEKKYQDMRNCK